MTAYSTLPADLVERFRNVFPGGPYEAVEIDTDWGRDAASVPQALGRDSYPDWFEVAVLDAIPQFRWRGQYTRYANKFPLRGSPDDTTTTHWGDWHYVYRPSFICVSHEELGA